MKTQNCTIIDSGDVESARIFLWADEDKINFLSKILEQHGCENKGNYYLLGDIRVTCMREGIYKTPDLQSRLRTVGFNKIPDKILVLENNKKFDIGKVRDLAMKLGEEGYSVHAIKYFFVEKSAYSVYNIENRLKPSKPL
ncbi:MAG: hypothetical protein KJ674_04385 [Nanoarchaeota archaeon]|nr:hypothetical protein [Nanoarchaeota archaeon]